MSRRGLTCYSPGSPGGVHEMFADAGRGLGADRGRAACCTWRASTSSPAMKGALLPCRLACAGRRRERLPLLRRHPLRDSARISRSRNARARFGRWAGKADQAGIQNRFHQQMHKGGSIAGNDRTDCLLPLRRSRRKQRRGENRRPARSSAKSMVDESRRSVAAANVGCTPVTSYTPLSNTITVRFAGL